jgi:protein CpxP
MKKFVIALVITAASSIAFAQAPDAGTPRHHARHESLQQLGAKLNLTDAQKQQMKDIKTADHARNQQLYADFHAKLQEFRTLRQSSDPRADEVKAELKSMKPQIQEARKTSRESMLGILTPEQRTQLASIRHSQGAHRAEARQMRGHAIAKNLNLTDEQKAQVKQLRESTKSANAELFANARAKRQELRSLTRSNDPAAADAKAQLEALRPQLKEAREQQHAAFVNILTPEQRTQLDQLKAARKAKRSTLGLRRRAS